MIGPPATFRRRLLAWYSAHRRDLPWRVPMGSDRSARPDPYCVLVSEAMLQQTQVGTVVSFYKNFLALFPTVEALAAAPEQAVLRAWQGLGYYARARNLHRSAKAIVERFGGRVPTTVEDLLSLPGVGRYTAGAVASLAFDVPAAILDGNVARVLCRLDLVRVDPRDRQTQARLWARAGALVPRRRAGDFNSALMELGATVCTPRAPKCLICPVREHCEAAAAGLADAVPPPRKSRPTPLRRRVVLCLARVDPDGAARFLIEQRPRNRRWAGMWQFVTREAGRGGLDETWSGLRRAIGPFDGPRPILRIGHQLTHRRYEFAVYAARLSATSENAAAGRWVTLGELGDYPLPKPHLMIARELTAQASRSAAPRQSGRPGRARQRPRLAARPGQS